MNVIEIKEEDKVFKGILLARFNMVDSHCYDTKNFFGKLKTKFIDINKNYCLVFLPWKHKEKELSIILTESVIKLNDLEGKDVISVENYITLFYEEKPFFEEFKISNFTGYKFIHEDKSFIANVKEHCYEKPLTLLYKVFPELLTLELDNVE